VTLDLDLLPVVAACQLAPGEPKGPGWLVNGLWVHSGVGIIGGAPKSAKSWLALEMGVAVASATPCLGRFPVEKAGSVLLYAAEDAPSIVRSRLESLASHRGLKLETLPIQVITAESVRLDLEEDQKRLKRTVGALRPALLILDPFVRLHHIDENSAGEVSQILAYLRSLQRSFDLAVALVHHARKNGSAASPGQSLRGSTDFHAWGDTNLYMRRRDNDLILTIEHRCAPAPDPLVLQLCNQDPEAVHLQCSDHPADRPAPARSVDIQQQTLDLIKASDPKPLTRSTLRHSLGLRNERLGNLLRSLEEEGRIERGTGGWRLTRGKVHAQRSAEPRPTSHRMTDR
jgi:AAA domain